MQGQAIRSEFRNGWRVVAAASIGSACGISGIPFNLFGALIAPVQTEFGWGRGEIQAGLLCMSFGSIIAFLVVAPWIDRIGARPVALISCVGFGAALLVTASISPSLPLFLLCWGLVGLLGAGTSPVTWTRLVGEWFDRGRGMAFAIALMGVSIATIIIQVLSSWLVGLVGWRGVIALSALPSLLIALPLGFIWFRSRCQQPAGHQTLQHEGTHFRDILRDRRLWLLSLVVILVTLGGIGIAINLKPLIADAGLDISVGALAGGALGVGAGLGRLLFGFLIDRYPAPYVSLPFLTLPAAACLVLAGAATSPPLVIVSALLVGLAFGAETDLMAFLVARYWGLRSYARTYGLVFAIYGIAAGLAPALFGAAHDRFGSYDVVLFAAAIGFCLSAALLFALGPYPDHHRQEPAGSSNDQS